MMNYIWTTLLVAALGFALWIDVTEIATDRYANNRPLPAQIDLPSGPSGSPDVNESLPVKVSIAPDTYTQHFHKKEPPPGPVLLDADLILSPTGNELRISQPSLPDPLPAIRAFSDESNKLLRGTVIGLPPDFAPGAAGSFDVQLALPAVRFVKLRAITNAAFEFAKTAATLALGFIGIFALWMGLMKIAEASGLIDVFVLLVQPFLRLLFPEVPKGHPALGMIAMNLSANMLGLGNAATPFGLKAMEQLQSLNPKPDTATNPMVMLLALNTAGVQLLPSATLVAVMGMSSMRVFLPILVVTGISLVAAIIATRLLGRLRAFRSTDPGTITQEVQP